MSYLSHSGANVPGSESSRKRKFQGAKVPGSESTRERKFHLWYFRSWERKYVGTKVPVTQHKLMLSALYAVARPSVCPSVRWVDQPRTVKVKTMKFSPYGSAIALVFAR